MNKRSFNRNQPSRESGRRILIACEGLVTERRYFEAIRQDLRLSRVEIFVVPHKGSDPHSVVVAAIDAKREQEREGIWPKGSSAWAVFDGDEHIQNNRQNWNNAIQKASQKDINLAISNPSFEFWYLIHFQDHSANLTRVDALRLLKDHVLDYEKSKVLYPEPLGPLTQDAIQRAKQLRQCCESNGWDEHTNPCCHKVAELVQSLLNLQAV